MAAELEKTLLLIQSGNLRWIAGYESISTDLLRLHHVAFSGDGEPTLSARFAQAVEAAVHLRARGLCPFFKMVLITNGTGLDLEPVQQGLQYFAPKDEIWIKLDAGSQDYADRVNRSEVRLSKVLENIRLVGRSRPIIIQSLFPAIDGHEPSESEIDEYIRRLAVLKGDGVQISRVQIYSATRPPITSDCRRLPLKKLAAIGQRIKTGTGLKTEVF
jgi:wyosine [tRNA(Phe)-imidazoG37] synthetase (radical SAM superfamily)